MDQDPRTMPRHPLMDYPKDTSRDWPIPFQLRVKDAKKMLRDGVHERDIIKKHGSVVLRAVVEGTA